MQDKYQPNLGMPLSLMIPVELYDDWIKDKFPSFQQKNRCSKDVNVIIDFSQCQWVSPLPLLALVVELMSYSDSGRRIDLILGEGASTGSLASNRSRTRKFLSVHGFFLAFLSRGDLSVRFQFDKTAEYGDYGCWFVTKTELQILWNILENSSGNLVYGDSIVLSATAWQLPRENDPDLSKNIREQVQQLLQKADSALFKFKTEARKYRDVTLQRLTQSLLELVENAAEHAYFDTTNGHVGLYARVRQSVNDDASKTRQKELTESTLLNRVLLNEKQHQIEVFVVDVGRGLFSDIDTWIDDELDNISASEKQKQPLRATAAILFCRPLSRHNRNENSVAGLRGNSTGLVHLNSILSHQHDSSRIITGHEWLAGTHPRSRGFHKNTMTSGDYKLQNNPVNGTIFHFGISFAEIPELDSKWFVSDKPESKDFRQSIINKFSKPIKQHENQVIDIRSGDGLIDIRDRVKERAKTKDSTVIRVNRIAEKNLLNSMINYWIKGVGESQIQKPLLYLCDLGRFQAVDIVWVVKNMFRKYERIDLNNVPAKASIFLVTEDLCCTELKVNFKPHPSGNNQYIVDLSEATKCIDNLETRLVYVLDALRKCDTDRLWNRIDVLNKEWSTNPVLLNDVQWDSSRAEVMPHYLNFSVLIQDQEAARYVRRALRRILALFPDANDHALDGLVDSALHDAKKWLIRPKIETNQLILVGSLSVTGSTLKRYIPKPKITIVGVIDCIQTPYYNKSDSDKTPHLAALLWKSTLPVKTNNSPCYRRVGKSAFIEPINGGINLGKTCYDEKLYQELETNHLVKLGHWSYADRHSLLELNAELAIEQSGASESGAIPWLADQISELCEQHPIVLAFPVDKLAYRLAHQVKLRVKGDITLLPLSFLPRFAGGITRLSPLVLDSAKKLAENTVNRSPLAIFIDFGFVTNRTLRHIVRQLHVVGFKEVRAIGLLNRSSAPAFDFEKNLDESFSAPILIPKAYWTWNIPILGTGVHCALCSALPALARLRRVAEEAHVDLLEPIKNIGNTWRARDIADFWEESGLPPLPLNDELREEIGPLFQELGFERLPFTSSILTARIIEFLRATGDIDLPLNVAKKLLSVGGSEHAVELLATMLMLTGSSFAASDLYDYVALLAESAIDLETRVHQSGHTVERRSRLLGLVALVFATQSNICKLLVLERLCQQLESKDINDSTNLRIALIALTTDSDESTEVQQVFHDRCLTDTSKSQLFRNYLAIRPKKGTLSESWAKLTKAFGRSSSHSQQSVLGHLLAELDKDNDPLKELPNIKRLTNLLGKCDQRFVDECLGVDLADIIDKASKLPYIAKEPSTTSASLRKHIEQTFRPISTPLHAVLKRFGDRAESDLIYDLFYDMLREQTKLNNLALMKDVVLTKKALDETWPNDIGGYLPICGYVSLLFNEIFSNIFGKSISTLPPTGEPEFADLTEEAKAWIYFDTTKEKFTQGITVVIVTGLDPNKPKPTEFTPVIHGLFDFGILVKSNTIKQLKTDKYFEIRVRIPSLASILR